VFRVQEETLHLPLIFCLSSILSSLYCRGGGGASGIRMIRISILSSLLLRRRRREWDKDDKNDKMHRATDISIETIVNISADVPQ
jgi:hypothetical protein